MFSQDMYHNNAKPPCLPMGVWVTFAKNDNAALTHLLVWLRNYFGWDENSLHTRKNVRDDLLPLSQHGRRAIPLRELIVLLSNFNPETDSIGHDIHIGFLDAHRSLFTTYLTEVAKLRANMTITRDTTAIDFANDLWRFYTETMHRYFPKLLN